MHSLKNTRKGTHIHIKYCLQMLLNSIVKFMTCCCKEEKAATLTDLQPNWKIVSLFLSVVHRRRNKAKNIGSINSIYTDPACLSGEVSFNNDCTFILHCSGLSPRVCFYAAWWNAFNHIPVWIYLEIIKKKNTHTHCDQDPGCHFRSSSPTAISCSSAPNSVSTQPPP